MSDRETDRLFRVGQYEAAAKRLHEGLQKEGEEGKDSLLYLLDYGLALHASGKYDEAIKAFLQADKLAEIKDYTSLATEAGTLLTSENIKSYKAEDFENVLISNYLAMDYALVGDYENALVEARRVNRKLYLMVTEGQRKYKQNAFARYLSAVVYEAEKEWNDAYVDYKKAWELEPDFPGIGRDLWRMAWILGMSDETDRWEREFRLTSAEIAEAKKLHPRNGMGEIVVLYENGISPIKRPNPQFSSLPKFYPRFNPVLHAEVDVDGKVAGATSRLHDIETTAIQNLDEKYGGMIAKKIAGVVAKEVVANEIRKKNEFLGAIAWIAMYASNQTDVRSWNLLPRDLQVLRIPVEPGMRTVRVRPVGAGPEAAREKTVSVGKGKKVFVNFRYMP